MSFCKNTNFEIELLDAIHYRDIVKLIIAATSTLPRQNAYHYRDIYFSTLPRHLIASTGKKQFVIQVKAYNNKTCKNDISNIKISYMYIH